MEPAEASRPWRRPQPRARDYRHVVKIMACGCMIGTAILFPLANAEGLWFRAVTLSLFILCALGFHALHIEPFVRFGPFTAAAALILLLVAVLAAGSSRRELIPWLLLFIASLSLITVAIYEVSQHVGPRSGASNAREDLAEVSIDNHSDHSLRSLPTRVGMRIPLESDGHNPLYFAHLGPSSRCSQQTGTPATDIITLSGLQPRPRPDWDPQTRRLVAGHALLELDVPGQALGESADSRAETGQNQARDLDTDSDLDLGPAESSRPLLSSVTAVAS